MIRGIHVSGFKEEEKKLTLKEERSGLLSVRHCLFSKVVEGARENVLVGLTSKFRGLSYEDLEEVYNDACLVLWEKMTDKGFELREKSLVGYLFKICWNIGMHYLRKLNEDVVSFNMIMERGYVKCGETGRGIEDMFDVMDEEKNDEEIFEKLDMVWGKLKDVDRMILESYYVDGCKMEEIARRVGYRNGNCVKSKKNKVLRRMLRMMKKQRADHENQPIAA